LDPLLVCFVQLNDLRTAVFQGTLSSRTLYLEY